ncbi:MAG: 2-C-methyl-D-erythritol 4-phosphate cytidylyltransferase [Terrisporobacter sp.]
MYVTQAPQGYYMEKIMRAHDESEKRNINAPTSSSELLIELGEKVHLFIGERQNIKVTTPEDLYTLRSSHYYSHYKRFAIVEELKFGLVEQNQMLMNLYREDVYEITRTEIPWKDFNNKTILITGAGGFIGYYLTASLLLRNDLHNQNIKVLGMVRNEENAKLKYGSLLNRNDFELVVQDVCNKFYINENVKLYNPYSK